MKKSGLTELMKTKQPLFVISITFAFSVACQALTAPFTNENSTPIQTQETIAQPTTIMPFETPTTEGNINNSSTESLDADYFLTDDAYNVVKNENGTLEFYTNLWFDEIGDYYRQELPLHGYSEIFVDGPRPVEGCVQMFFEGDPSGKILTIMVCIIFQTEEFWVSVGLVDK
jgi:hypothetical protein